MASSSLPVLYLNRLEHKGKVFIKFYYKAHTGLTKKLEQTSGVRFSSQYNCFVTHYNLEQLQAIRQTFYRQAILDTRYLHRRTTQSPTDNTFITQPAAAGTFASAKENKDKPLVKLVPFSHENKMYLKLQYQPDSGLYQHLKDVAKVKWSATYGCFVSSLNGNQLHGLVDLLLPVAQITLSSQIIIKDVALLKKLWEQQYWGIPSFLPCPLAYLEKMHLLNYSPRTMRTYHSLLLRFLNFYPQEGLAGIAAFTPEQVNRFHEGMQQRGQSFVYINQSINAIKFYYSKVLNRLDMNLADVNRPYQADKLPKVLSLEEVAAILRVPVNIKHRCLLQLLYAGGLRIGEVINLKISDVQSQRNLLLIRGGKGQKERTTLLSGKLLEELRTYYQLYKPKN